MIPVRRHYESSANALVVKATSHGPTGHIHGRLENAGYLGIKLLSQIVQRAGKTYLLSVLIMLRDQNAGGGTDPPDNRPNVSDTRAILADLLKKNQPQADEAHLEAWN